MYGCYFFFSFLYELPFEKTQNLGSETSLYGACRGPERTCNKLKSKQASKRRGHGILGYLCRRLMGGEQSFCARCFYVVKSDALMGLNVADVT